MHLREWILMLLVIGAFSVKAQQVGSVDGELESWIEELDDEECASEWSDLLIALSDSPINVNDISAMATLPFLTPFQMQALRNYILLHGQLLSLKELYVVPGFDSAFCSWVSQFLIAEPYEADRRWNLLQCKVDMVSGIGGVSRAVSDTFGDGLRSLIAVGYSYRDKLSFRFAADKDPSELWGKNNFVNYHLMLNHVGHLERIIVGRYNLQFGQGLTMWSGLRPFNWLGNSVLRYGQGVRPASTFYEQNYQEGVAATVGLGRRMHLSGFASMALGERLVGGHAEYRNEQLIIGITGAFSRLDDSVQWHDYVYNQEYFRGDRLLNLGADWIWNVGRTTLYGEVAVDDSGACAALAGASFKVDSRNSVGVVYRRYPARFHSLHAQAYALGTCRNEEGLTLDGRAGLPWGINVVASVDLHRSPSLKYGAYGPSSGEWMRAQMSKSFGRHWQVVLRAAYRRKERNVPNVDSTVYVGESTMRCQWQAEAHWTRGRWQFVGRGVSVGFESDGGVHQSGWAVMQTAIFSAHNLQVVLSGSYFNSDGYYSRIYLNERQLQYAFSMPMLIGIGFRGYGLVRYSLGERLTLSAKGGITYRVDSSSRQIQYSWMLQARWKW